MHVKEIEINWTPDLSVYASENFLKAVGDEYGWLGGYGESEELCCILPYTVVCKSVVRMVRFRVETIVVGEKLEINEEREFLSGVVDYFRSVKTDMIIPATTNTIFRTYPAGAVVAPYGSFIIDLTQPEDVLWNNLHSKHRNVIRNATKKGVEIREGVEYLDLAHGIIRDTLLRSKLSFISREELRRFIESLQGSAKVFVAFHEGLPQGCAVIPYSQYSAYYLYGGTIASPLTGATNLLQWEAIKTFHSLGVRRYDFVGVRINPERGSKQEGLAMFKQRFGGKLVQGFMWKYPLNPVKSAIYSLGVRLLRGGDIVDIEKHKMQALREET